MKNLVLLQLQLEIDGYESHLYQWYLRLIIPIGLYCISRRSRMFSQAFICVVEGIALSNVSLRQDGTSTI